MADDLKRVGLVFKADGTVDFKKSLMGVTNAVKENEAEFKKVKSAWNDSTSSMDKLKDRQKYLSEQTDTYSEKVKKLEAILKEQTSTQNVSASAISKTKVELAEATSKMNYYKSGLEEVNKDLKNHTTQLKEAAEKTKEFGDHVTNLGKKVSIASAAVGALAGASVKVWGEVDEGMDIVTKKTGATGKALEGMQTIAKNIAKEIPTDFKTAGEAVGEVNTRFGLQGDELQKLSEQYIKFADLNDTDVSSAIDSTQAAMAAFNIDAENAANFLDTLNKAGQDTGKSVTDLASELTSNANALQELGLNASDSITFLSQLNKAGVDASTAIAGLKKAYANSAKSGTDMNTTLTDLQNKLRDHSTQAEATQEAIELFGAKSGASIAKYVADGKLNFTDFSTSLDENSNNISQTFEETLDPLDKTKMVTNELKELGSEIIEDVGPQLTEILKDIKNAVSDLKEKWDSMSDDQKDTVITIAEIILVAGPLLLIIGQIAGAISSIITFCSTLIPIISTIIAVIGGPVLLAIGAVIAAIVAIWVNFDSVKQLLVWAWDDLKSVWDNTIGALKQQWDWLCDDIGTFIDDFKQDWDDAFDNLGRIWDDFVDGIEEAWKDFKKFFSDIGDDIGEIWDSICDFIKVPHFSIEGEFSLSKMTVPHLAVDWYANGGILNSPTIFGSNGGNLMGGGEAGPEAVLPISNLLDYMRTSNAESNEQLIAVLPEVMANAFATAMEKVGLTVPVYLGNKQIAEATTQMVVKELNRDNSNNFRFQGVQ